MQQDLCYNTNQYEINAAYKNYRKNNIKYLPLLHIVTYDAIHLRMVNLQFWIHGMYYTIDEFASVTTQRQAKGTSDIYRLSSYRGFVEMKERRTLQSLSYQRVSITSFLDERRRSANVDDTRLDGSKWKRGRRRIYYGFVVHLRVRSRSRKWWRTKN